MSGEIATNEDRKRWREWASRVIRPCSGANSGRYQHAQMVLALDARLELADAMEKAAEAVVVNARGIQADVGDGGPLYPSGAAAVGQGLLTDLDNACDAYCQAKEGTDAS